MGRSTPSPPNSAGGSIQKSLPATCTDITQLAPADQSLVTLLGASYQNSNSDRCYNLEERTGGKFQGGQAACVAPQQGGSGPRNGSSKCTDLSSICYQSSCDKQGVLWLTVQSNSKSNKAQTLPCRSGSVVDLVKLTSSRYTLGKVVCPDNAVVCGTLSAACKGCSSKGGYCARGKCYCHMEYTGANCQNSLVPAG